MLLGGNFQFITGFSGGNYPLFTIKPSVAYFTGNRNAIGLSVGYNRSYTPLFVGGALKLNEWSFSVFDRKYFSIGNEEKLYFFLNSSFDYVTISRPDNNTVMDNLYNIAVSPGISYFPTRSVGIDLSVPGLSYSNTNEYLIFDAGLSNVRVGISILLNRKKKD